MAADKRGKNSSRNDGGSQASEDDQNQEQGMAAGMQGAAAQAGRRVREGMESAKGELTHRYRRAEGIVARNPAPSVLTSFGVGFGLGVLLTLLLSQREEETWAERNIPDSWRNLPDRLRNMQVPDSLARHLPSR